MWGVWEENKLSLLFRTQFEFSDLAVQEEKTDEERIQTKNETNLDPCDIGSLQSDFIATETLQSSTMP